MGWQKIKEYFVFCPLLTGIVLPLETCIFEENFMCL